jgi:hypothetical protein
MCWVQGEKIIKVTVHASMQPVYIFMDNANIFIPAQEIAASREDGSASREVRIQFDRLYELARASRQVKSALCVGSVPPEMDAVWVKLRTSGVNVELFERGEDSRSEQGVDQCLQVHMLRALVDVEIPGVVVLLTGDGAGYWDGVGFHADLERMKRKGWGVEVLSWEASCNKRLKAWAEQVGVFIRLEDHYNSVTFRKGIRNSVPLSLKQRKLSTPGYVRPAA